jgi:hypothetical protein
METSQGNSLCSYLKQTKMSFFFLLQNRRIGGQNQSCLGTGLVPLGRGEEVRKGHRRVSTVQILCIHVRKQKNDTSEIVSGMGVGG